MKNNISEKFTFRKLLMFAFPSIIMMIFMSLYTIIDGFFVSRFVSKDALSAINIAYPMISVIVAIGVMFATGGSAIVSINIGENKYFEAKSNFSLIFFITVAISTIIGIFCMVFSDFIVTLLGAEGILVLLASKYLRILMFFAPFNAVQLLFQSFFVVAGKATLGLVLTIIGGFLNIIFDYIFIVVMHMGISGAAYATAISYLIPSIGGLIFFICNKNGLFFIKPIINFNVIMRSILNGSSEMITHLSGSIITLLFNIYMINLEGSDGVASITAVLYVEFLMNAFFLGFTIGVAPIISYNYGSHNKNFLIYIIKKCKIFIFISSIIVYMLSFYFSEYISEIFFDKYTNAYNLSVYGLKIFSTSFIFSGINIFSAGIFTAIGNGNISALISFSRTLFFTFAGIIFLSFIFKTTGLWLSVPLSEMITFVISFCSFRFFKTKCYIF